MISEHIIINKSNTIIQSNVHNNVSSKLAGFFTVKKSEGPFGKMAFDQCHEQNNKVIKSKSVFF